MAKIFSILKGALARSESRKEKNRNNETPFKTNFT